MPAISPIVINDAAATPLSHIFSVAKQGLQGFDSVAEFEDRVVNSGIPVGFYKVSMNFSRPNKARKTYRVTLKLSTPKLETLSNSTVSGIMPAPTVSYTPMVEITFVVPERSALQDRKDLRTLTANLLASSQVVAAIEQLDMVY